MQERKRKNDVQMRGKAKAYQMHYMKAVSKRDRTEADFCPDLIS